MAFLGTPLESFEDDDSAEEAVTGALLLWSGIDEIRTLRIRFEQFLEALSKAGKAKGKKR